VKQLGMPNLSDKCITSSNIKKYLLRGPVLNQVLIYTI